MPSGSRCRTEPKKSFASLLGDTSTADVCFKARSAVFAAHKVFFAAHSPVFKVMFFGRFVGTFWLASSRQGLLNVFGCASLWF